MTFEEIENKLNFLIKKEEQNLEIEEFNEKHSKILEEYEIILNSLKNINVQKQDHLTIKNELIESIEFLIEKSEIFNNCILDYDNSIYDQEYTENEKEEELAFEESSELREDLINACYDLKIELNNTKNNLSNLKNILISNNKKTKLKL